MREIDSFFYLRLALINFAAMPKMLTVFFAWIVVDGCYCIASASYCYLFYIISSSYSR